MDQTKIGSFLKELRLEKGLTQGQLAEQLNVSNRSVSRWETGNTLPDLSILIVLAEFYDVEIKEIIDGERKSENMNNEIKETAQKISDYTEAFNQQLKKRVLSITVVALIGMIIFIVIEANGLDVSSSVYEKIASVGLGVSLGGLTIEIMYLTGILAKIKHKRWMRKHVDMK